MSEAITKLAKQHMGKVVCVGGSSPTKRPSFTHPTAPAHIYSFPFLRSIFCSTYSKEWIPTVLGNGDLMLFMQIKYWDCHSFPSEHHKDRDGARKYGEKTTWKRLKAGQIWANIFTKTKQGFVKTNHWSVFTAHHWVTVLTSLEQPAHRSEISGYWHPQLVNAVFYSYKLSSIYLSQMVFNNNKTS